MNNRFDPEKFYDHKIVDEKGATVGHIRIKPSGISWKPSSRGQTLTINFGASPLRPKVNS
jgi:hypothetical protein